MKRAWVFSVSAVMTFAPLAHADEAPIPIVPEVQAPPPTPEPAAPPVPVVVPAPQALPLPGEANVQYTRPRTEEAFFRLYGAISAAVTQPAFDWQLGARFRLSDRFMVGLDAEVDGLIGVQTPKFRTGMLNIYVTGIFRYPLHFERINLRSTVQLGTSTMLIDLYGAPRGTTGIYVGGVPLGIEWKVADHFFLVFDILGIALPAPQLEDAPFAYPQYRTAAGIEVAF